MKAYERIIGAVIGALLFAFVSWTHPEWIVFIATLLGQMFIGIVIVVIIILAILSNK